MQHSMLKLLSSFLAAAAADDLGNINVQQKIKTFHAMVILSFDFSLHVKVFADTLKR